MTTLRTSRTSRTRPSSPKASHPKRNRPSLGLQDCIVSIREPLPQRRRVAIKKKSMCEDENIITITISRDPPIKQESTPRAARKRKFHDVLPPARCKQPLRETPAHDPFPFSGEAASDVLSDDMVDYLQHHRAASDDNSNDDFYDTALISPFNQRTAPVQFQTKSHSPGDAAKPPSRENLLGRTKTSSPSQTTIRLSSANIHGPKPPQ
jgi:hypothetical protein